MQERCDGWARAQAEESHRSVPPAAAAALPQPTLHVGLTCGDRGRLCTAWPAPGCSLPWCLRAEPARRRRSAEAWLLLPELQDTASSEQNFRTVALKPSKASKSQPGSSSKLSKVAQESSGGGISAAPPARARGGAQGGAHRAARDLPVPPGSPLHNNKSPGRWACDGLAVAAQPCRPQATSGAVNSDASRTAVSVRLQAPASGHPCWGGAAWRRRRLCRRMLRSRCTSWLLSSQL